MFTHKDERLINALKASHWHVVKTLLQAGANLNVVDTILYAASIAKMRMSSEIDFALLTVWIEKCVEAGRSVELGWTPLHKTAYEGTDVEHLDTKSQMQIADALGWTLLHLAAWKGHIEVVRYLLSVGACLTAPNMLGLTPLHLGVQCPNPT